MTEFGTIDALAEAEAGFVARPGEINHDPLDRFTFAHAGAGAVMGLFRLPWWVALLGAITWDLVERVLKYGFPEAFPHHSQDVPQHVATDVAAWMLGWAVTKQLVNYPRLKSGA